MFTALIEKPKMNEKLLSKPPFKYLFDIFSETTKKTGFVNGTPSLNSRPVHWPGAQR
jgi:TRAF3-interacting protein 1